MPAATLVFSSSGITHAAAFRQMRAGQSTNGSHDLRFDESDTVSRVSLTPGSDLKKIYGTAPVFVFLDTETDSRLLAAPHRSPALIDALQREKLFLVFLGSQARIPTWAAGAPRLTSDQASARIFELESTNDSLPDDHRYDSLAGLLNTIVTRADGWEGHTVYQILKSFSSFFYTHSELHTAPRKLDLKDANDLILATLEEVHEENFRARVQRLSDAVRQGHGEPGEMGSAEKLLDIGDVLREMIEAVLDYKHRVSASHFPQILEMAAVQDELNRILNGVLKQIYESVIITTKNYDPKLVPEHNTRSFVFKVHTDLEVLGERLNALSKLPRETLAEHVRKVAIEPPPALPYGVSDLGAEYLARDWMLAMGIHDATVTQFTADGGVDVESAEWVAQVKNYRGTIGIESVRALAGVASSSGKKPIFFTTGRYPRSAHTFAEASGMALFRLLPNEGKLEVCSTAAESLVEDRD